MVNTIFKNLGEDVKSLIKYECEVRSIIKPMIKL